MEVIRGSIYDWPKYYEFVYGSDWKAECVFLNRCFQDFVDGQCRRLFEPACGTGRLIYRLAEQGFDVGGLDLNPKAIEFCNKRFCKNQLPPTAWIGNMCDFEVKPTYDAGFNTINSFRHLLTENLAIEHLHCMNRAIRPGGIYVLGLHLTPTTCEPDDNESWSHRRGHLQINTSMWLVETNTEDRYETHSLAFDVYTPSKQFRIQDEIRFRTYTVDQFKEMLEAVPTFEIAEIFDFGYEIPIQLNGDTQDAVFVLKRK